MRERPILFSGPMVRAILAGTKTQTRRIAKNVRHPDLGNLYAPDALARERQHVIDRACPYGQPGDRLWVREAFAQGFEYDAVQDRFRQYDEDGNELPMKTWYRATDADIRWADDDGWEASVPWRPSIHMPRSACRIVLQVIGVRVERLQSISEADARAEGLNIAPGGWWSGGDGHEAATPYDAYAFLWETINGPGSWAANPWVWVVKFRRLAT